ncbi:hypothetical protein G3N58_17475 [Paraburkholderia sp. Ac-20342]|nr:hypothetical protein [Paraburkholderia sp. Ac-20342]
MDWQALSLACRRANAAYIEADNASKAAFATLGDTWIGQVQGKSYQAVLSVDNAGKTWLSISGTRASQGALMDVLRDVQLDPVAVDGGHVTAGVAEDMDEIWCWAQKLAPEGTVFNLTGHSLGAARVQASVAFVKPEQIGLMFAFASPKFIAADLFKSHAAVFARMVACVNGADGWCSWPWFDRRWQCRAPIPTVWLKNDQGAFQILPDGNQWQGGFAFGDHDIDNYQKRLETLAAAPMKPAA